MKILIAAGGSGGHIFPALALTRQLSGTDRTEIVFVASKRRLDKKFLENERFKKYFLSVNPMPYNLCIGIIIFLIKFLYDLAASCIILILEKPDVVVGFGGYVAGTVIATAAALGMNTVIHEQNLVPGRANRILDRLVRKVAVSFDESRSYFRNKNTKFTGNPLRSCPVRRGKEDSLCAFGFENSKFTLLIMGGSQGARSLNRLTSEAITMLSHSFRIDLQVIHLAGLKDCEKMKSVYSKHGINARVFSFIENIHDAYCVADLVISRAGSSAIFELAMHARPMILIPYPFSKNNQVYNAEYFSRKGAAVYVSEKHLSSPALKELIEELSAAPHKLENLSEKAEQLKQPHAAEKLAKEVLSVI